MKDKLIMLLNTDKDHAIQALELNKSLGLLSDKEIETILVKDLKQGYGWLHEALHEKMIKLDERWDVFLRKFKGYGDTFEWGDPDEYFETYPHVTLFGNLPVSFEPHTDRFDEYAKQLANPFLGTDGKILSWLSSQPEVKSVVGHPEIFEVGTVHLTKKVFEVVITVLIKLPSISELLVGE